MRFVIIILNFASKLVHHNPQVTIADDPLNFLSSTKVLKRVEQLLEIAKTRKLVRQEIFVVVAYLAAHIIFKNGQRPGVVQRMAINEWTQRVEEDKEWVIYVVEHKTTGSFGPAKVVISNSICSIMEQYFVHVRAKIIPKHPTFQNRFFLTNTGNEFSKVGERMKDTAKTFGLLLPTVGLQRKVVATEVYKTQDDITVRGVQKQMCHGTTTCEKFYQLTDARSAIEAKRTIEKVMQARHFTKAESDAVIKEYPLDEEITPSLAICQAIAEKHNLKKTKKQIQDHWRARKHHK